ncbi:hypothetical protein CSA56_12535 [candidate division KSB3 bacterium]|uniref:Uncharacterized protein n=1 Tax=candidate division KSB3 bacterium TaxID=2044937 RepID=A0A2G6KER3_9BACT|nr:MAG: hypothetical protein CSA56_12535 [candidate division KSB3 bacterium]
MPGYEGPDLIESICEGKGTRFNGTVCDFYTCVDRICSLLQRQQLEDFWNLGRCAYIVLQTIEECCLKTLHEMYEGLPLGDSIDYDMQSVVQRLKQQHLEFGFNLAVWHRYVYTTVYREIRKQLTFLPDKKHCGTCKHISKTNGYVCMERGEIRSNLDFRCLKYQPKAVLSEPPEVETCQNCEHLSRKSYFCYARGETRNKTDEVCEQYSQDISANFVSLDEERPNSGGAASQYVDHLLYKINQENEYFSDAPDAALLPQDELETLQTVLQDRIESVSAGTKKHDMYERQYRLFMTLLFKLYDDMPEEDAIKSVAQEYDVKEWTVKRDIKDVREYLKNVLEYQARTSS